jgi:biotin carboxyl carrier protein
VKLKHGSRVHEVRRRSATEFSVDDARVSIEEARRPSRRVFVARAGDRVFAQVGARSYVLDVVSRSGAAVADSGAPGGLEAPMPGRVTRVNVSVGDTVTRGQELIVVEAMKMENALVAPEAGTVKSLAVKTGDMVAPGPALIVIEARS